MTEVTTEGPAEIGHNLPPTPTDLIQTQLAEDHADLLTRQADLIAAYGRVPAECDDDNIAKFTDFVSQINTCQKVAEALRVAAKAPSIVEGKAVDGFFKPAMEALDDYKSNINVRMTNFQRKKADAERRAREEEARIAAEEARAAEQRLADARAATEKAALDERVATEEIARKAAADKKALDEADAAREAAEKAAVAAAAKPAELSRSRGTMGGTASLRTRWTGEVTDRANLDIALLRDHIGLDALNIAVRSFVKAGGRDLAGAYIHEVSNTVVS